MSLQIWLPLNGNINNQGLSDIEFSNASATVDANGKIGSCYYFNGDTHSIYANQSFSFTKASIACWVKLNTIGTTSQWICNFNYGGGGNAKTLLGFYITTDGILYTAGQSNATYSTTVQTDTWYHICLTWDIDVGRNLYVNGSLVKSDTTKGTSATATNFSISGRATTSAGTSHTYGITGGYINDVRFYDHALSPKEVAEIAKGLVVHYTLSSPPIKNLMDQRNMTENYFIQSNGTPKTTNGWYITDYIPIDPSTDYIASSVSKGGSGTYFALYDANKSQTRTVLITANVNPTFTSSASEYFVRFSLRNLSNEMATAQLEKGTVATEFVRFYPPEMFDTTEYDVSGYGYDGIKNNLISSSDSPVNQSCYVFNGTNSWLKCNTNVWMVQGCEELTINFWGYSENWATETDGGRMFSCTQTGGLNIEGGSSGYLKFQRHVYTNEGKTSSAYSSNTSGLKIADLTSGWHMFTLIYTTEGEQIYLDGALHSSYNVTTYGIHWNRSARLYLGCEANTANPTSPYFNGKMVDFRLYMTALTANQVMELYNTPVSLANNGTLFGHEFIEEG